MKRICVIGLGRLGSAFYACWHKKGFAAVGIDKNQEIVKQFSKKIAPLPEPGLQEVMDETRASMFVTSDTDSIPEIVRNSDVIFVLINTPARADGTFSSDAIEDLAGDIGWGLGERDDYPVVVVASTVSPTAIEEHIIPALEKRVEKDRKGLTECGKDFGVCYIPEWVALGELIHGFLNPELCLIGASDEKAGDIMEELYRDFLDNDPPFVRTNIVNAEIAKVSLNAYIATKITFANIIAQVCEGTPGADAAVVTSTIGMDSRIGKKYFKGSNTGYLQTVKNLC